MALHWPARIFGAQVRLGDTAPERDSNLRRFIIAHHEAQQQLAAASTAIFHQVEQDRAKIVTHAIDKPTAHLSALGLAFVQMCQAFELDAEIVIEDAVQKYEARKTPAKEIPQPKAPTAAEISGRTSRQYTL